MASKPSFPGLPPVSVGVNMTSADNGLWKTIFACPAGGSGVLVGRLRGVSNDSAGLHLKLARVIGGTNYPVGFTVIPAGAGDSAAVGWKDILSDLNQGESLALAPGESLSVYLASAITSGKQVTVHLEGAPL